MKKRICVVTGSRADYGLLRWVMKEIKKNHNLELIPVATGTHLSKKYGYTIQEIMDDGFRNLIAIDILKKNGSSPHAISQHISVAVSRFADLFRETKIDCLVLLGDRFEMLAVALASLPFNIPIGHIGGGEISEGVIDDNIRHCLTKLSHMHFTITKECAKRIRQMGEESWRIHKVGSPRLDFLYNVKIESKGHLRKKFGIKFNGKAALVVYHPVTLAINDINKQIDNLLKALSKVDNIEIIMLYPNLDTGSDTIIAKIRKFAKDNKNVILLKPLRMSDYLSILSSVDVLVGNSSIGIVEAPSFGLPFVNVGDRQRGRDCLSNVINVGYSWQRVVKGIKKALYDYKFRNSLKKIKNPYGDGYASKRIVSIISKINFNKFKIMKNNCFDD